MKASARTLQVVGILLIVASIFALGGIIAAAGTAAAQADEEPDGAAAQVFLPLIGGPGSTSALDAGVEPPVPVPAVPFFSSPYLLPTPEEQMEAAHARPPKQRPQHTTLKLIIDTDAGVDDAVAIDWLFSQRDVPVEVLGVVSVAGNNTVENTTRVAQIVLQQLGKDDIQVFRGAAESMEPPLTKSGYFLHGPDGLWGLNAFYPPELLPDASDQGATQFYCDAMMDNPGSTILALGPLTNIAAAIDECPGAMLSARVVILGGAKYGGNKTPNSEYNFWQDPIAASKVLNARKENLCFDCPLPQIVLLDAFSQTSVDMADLEKLFGPGEKNKANPATQFLQPAITAYVSAQIQNLAGGRALIPDAVAAFLALDPSEGAAQSALVKILPGEESGAPSLSRGQSIIGLTDSERFGMIATEMDFDDLAAATFPPPVGLPPDYDAFRDTYISILIAAAEPDNAIVVTAVNPKLLTHRVFPDLRKRGADDD